MKLKELFKNCTFQLKGKDVDVTGVTLDSRTITPGQLFVAKKSEYIPMALAGGAAAIVTDLYDPFLKCPQVIVKKVDPVGIAKAFYGKPKLFLVGVTGSKGKTTTSYLIQHLLDNCGLMSTVEVVVGEERRASTLTTHDVVFNYKTLKEMAAKGCASCVMEVSSHGLDQERVGGLEFDIGVFTNIYPDHLDYHQTMEHYAAAKKKLWTQSKQMIVNKESGWVGDINFEVENVRAFSDRTDFTMAGENYSLPLLGRFNVLNAAAAICVAKEKGVENIAEKLAAFPGVPARLERYGNVFIDFAHTGEALENALKTLKERCSGRVIVVFGAGGNRDPQRRVGMGRAAAHLADIAIVTNDNPRHEDPLLIAETIASQFPKRPLVELDREKAIVAALALAKKEDFVLIAGKGHEKVQIFGNRTIPFDDIAIVRQALGI